MNRGTSGFFYVKEINRFPLFHPTRGR